MIRYSRINALIVLFSLVMVTACQPSESSDTSSTNESGIIAGSTAALTYQNGNFIVLDSENVRSYRFPDEGLAELNGVYRVSGAESVFPEGDSTLYVGSSFGVTILDIDEDGNFTYIGQATHIASCDPVIVDGDTMFLTLRTTNFCTTTEGLNSLMIYDVTNPAEPVFISSLALNGPYGLSKSENTLWVCTTEGLASVDVTDVQEPGLITTYPEVICNDIIIRSPEDAIITTSEGIFLTDLSGSSPVIQSEIKKGE